MNHFYFFAFFDTTAYYADEGNHPLYANRNMNRKLMLLNLRLRLVWKLEFGYWDLFGNWNLDIGI